MSVEVIINTHRTSRVAGKDVTEYSVSARSVRPAQQDRQAADRLPGRCLSWHRYTDFRVLHDQCAAALGLGRWFPCPKALIFTDAQRQERADELHAYLQGCVAAAGDAPLPPALYAFLFTPTKGSTSKRSQSIADASPFVTASPFLLHPATETVAEIVTEEEEPGSSAAKALAFDEAAVGAAVGPGAAAGRGSGEGRGEDRMQQLAAGVAKAEAVAAAHAEVAVATKAGADADRMRHLASGAAKAEAQAAAQAVAAAAAKADEDADRMQQLAAAAAKAEAVATAQAEVAAAAKADEDADRMQQAAAAAKAEAVAAALAQAEAAAAAMAEVDADRMRQLAAAAANAEAEAEAEAAMEAATKAEEEAEAATAAATVAEAEAELAIAENAEAEAEEEEEAEAARSTYTNSAPNSASPKRAGSPLARTHQDLRLHDLRVGGEPGATPRAWWARCCAPLSDMLAAAKADMLAANSAILTPQRPTAAARR